MPQKKVLDFYASPGALTDISKYKSQIAQLPDDVGELARIVQGLVIHQFLAEPFYGVQIPDARNQEMQIRKVQDMLDTLLKIDNQPLSVERTPQKRFAGICRNFGTTMVALLRAKGVPARSRYGFGGYFNPPYFEDHHVCEYWDADTKRWKLADAQIDGDIWKERLGYTFDPLDVPRDQFLTAGDAWVRSRNGKADPSKIGTFNGNLYGLWFIATSLVRDVAALNKVEMLQWDVWGVQPKPGAEITGEQLEYFDKIAALTNRPDESFDELRTLYDKDERLHVPKKVFNAVLNKMENSNG